MKLIKRFESYTSREETQQYPVGTRFADTRSSKINVVLSYDDRGNVYMSDESTPGRKFQWPVDELTRLVDSGRIEVINSEEESHLNNTMTQEKKGEKWIKDAIKNPGSLRKSLGKKEGEKISKNEIDSELQALRGKDKDKSKKGVQGLSKKDLAKYRKLNLAKTLKGLKEHQETQNYMFFGNLQTMKRLIDEMLEMDESKVDEILKEHNWALDHIATSKDDVEEVFNFLKGHDEPHHEDELIGGPGASYPTHIQNDDQEDGEFHQDDEENSEIKSFVNFK
jgi:hypothetical protein